MEAARARRLERARVCQRVRKARLRAGEVEAGQARIAEPGGRLGQPDVLLRVVRPQRGADQADDGAGPRSAARAPAQTAAIPSLSGNPRATCSDGPQRISR